MTADHFLGVERSASGRRWVPRLTDDRLARLIAQRHDLPDVLARVLAARGVEEAQVEAYLNPTLRTLMPEPSKLKDMAAGVTALADAVMGGKHIGIITDYDVDGVCSAALLASFLRAVGAEVVVRIPDRVSEGYGPSIRAVEELKNQGTEVLVTLDCGVLAHDPLSRAAELGLTTVIVDHHQAGEELPKAVAVINPNRQDDTSGFGYLCAAGVTMILVSALNRHLREKLWYSEARPEPNMLRWLDLIALATVCDVVPLVGLNRAYVTQGLKVLGRRNSLGLAWLSDIARLKSAPDVYALGFALGPRLNAAGRVGHAATALELLMCTDQARAQQLAQQLEALNKQRQVIEGRVLDAALLQAEASIGKDGQAPLIMAAAPDWHPGVLGLAAARLKERYRRPAFALSIDKLKGQATGSGRSISGVDLGSAVRKALEAGLLLKGGGHAMAAGLTLQLEKLEQVKVFLETELKPQIDLKSQSSLAVDAALNAEAATLDLIEMIEQAGPYGSANPSPLFVLPAHFIRFAQPVGTDHIRCTVQSPQGSKLKGIAFRAMGSEMGELLLSERQAPLHIAARLQVDEWGGKRAPSLHIEDVAVPLE